MSRLPCAHASGVIRTMRQDVYKYVDICHHVSTQNLIYSSQFQLVATHNMPKLYTNGSLKDGEENSFLTLLPSKVKQPLESNA